MHLESNKIIVTGNGSSVLSHEVGHIIDVFVDVVRFNDYQIGGFEKYIGTKTTIWARSNSIRTIERDWKPFKQVIVIAPEWNYNNVPKLLKRKANGTAVPREDALNLQKELGLPGRKQTKKGIRRGWPSSGLILLDYLLKEHQLIYIHGFDHFRHIGKAPRHYYNNMEKMQVTEVHRGHKEEQWINKKIEEGRIRRLCDK